MYELTPELKKQFQQYVEAAEGSRADLVFVLDHIPADIPVDYSERSLELLEDLYRQAVGGQVDIPDELISLQDFMSLVCRYLGESIIHATNGKWVQSRERNRRFAQPTIEYEGCPEWVRVYPSELALHFDTLSETNPNFPGLQKGRVLAEQLRRATMTYHRETN